MQIKRFLAALVLLAAAAPALAQTVRIDALIGARDLRELEVVDGTVYGGLLGGGLLAWSEDDPAGMRRWTTTDGLAGNRITDLAWSGQALWAASEGAGLTRIEFTDGEPALRTIANLGDDLNLTAVAGVVQGESERVHFGLESGGVGIIIGGLPGAIATTDNTPGLVSDAVRDLLFVGDDLWIATAAGVSLLHDGLYSDAGEGLSGRAVRALVVGADGALLGATSAGVYRRDPDTGLWSRLGDLTASLLDVAVLDGEVWALSTGTTVIDRIHRWDGAAWTAENAPEVRTYALAAGDGLWCAGTLSPDAENTKARRGWAALHGDGGWTLSLPEGLVFDAVDGIDFAPDGSLWMGDHAAGAFAGWDGESLFQVYGMAASAPDSVGLFDDDGPMLDVAAAPDGTVWAIQFASGGVLRYDPASGAIDHMDRDNSFLPTNRLLDVVPHPDGAVLLLGDTDGVLVLSDPDRWRDDAVWAQLPMTLEDGLGGGNVAAAHVAARDRIWFAVQDVGVVLWDPNGAAGSADPLTWTDLSDDRFYGPLSEITGSNFSFSSISALEEADDGSLWISSSNGVIRIRPGTGGDPTEGVELLDAFREKTDASVLGLVRGDIRDLLIDGNGDVWACHEAGLDRIRFRGEEVYVDPFVGLAAFKAYALDGFYGPAALAPLPEGVVRNLALSPDGLTVAAGCDGGAVLFDLEPRGEDAGVLDPLFLYPNPLLPATHAGLRLGGISAEVVWTQTALVGGADVSIFNLEGQLVWRSTHVANDEVFWTGDTLEGGPAASGSYIVRIELGGQVVVQPLSVVR